MKRALIIAVALAAFTASGKPKETVRARCERRCGEDVVTCSALVRKAATKSEALCLKECGKLEKQCMAKCAEPRAKHKKKKTE